MVNADTDPLSRSLRVVDLLVQGVRPEQWTAPTPCTDWDVRRVVSHLVAMNLVFAALLTEQPLPSRGVDPLGAAPAEDFTESAKQLVAAFDRPGVLRQVFAGPLGEATGAQRMQMRVYDLLAHGWDIACATGQPHGLPEDVAEQSLAFVREHLEAQSRVGRFEPAQPVSDDAPAVEQLMAFLGRPVPWRVHRSRSSGS